MTEYFQCMSCSRVQSVKNLKCIDCGCYPSYSIDRYRDDLYGPKVGATPWYTKVTDLFTKKT